LAGANEDRLGSDVPNGAGSPVPAATAIELDDLSRLASLVGRNGDWDLLTELTGFLARTLQFEHAFVGEILPGDPGQVRTIGYFLNGKPVEGFTYALADSPCERVIGEAYCHYPRDVQNLFPRDESLVELGIECYAGVLLRSVRGEPLGLLVLMHHEARQLARREESLIRIAAARAAGALESIRAVNAMDLRDRDRHALLDALPDLLLRVASDGTFLQCKPGRDVPMIAPPEVFLGKPMVEVLPAELAVESLKHIQRAIGTGEVQVHEYQLTFDDTVHDFEARISRSGPAEVLMVVRDTTRHREAEQQLAIVYSALEQTADTVIITDRAGVVLYVNRAFEESTGYARAEIVGRHASMLFAVDHPDAPAMAVIVQVMRAGDVYSGLFATRCKDGTILLEDKNITPLTDEAGEVIRYVGTGRDVAERRLAQANLAEQEERFRQLAENIDGVFWVFCAQERRFLYASPAYERIWRRDVATLYSERNEWLRAVHPDDRDRVRRAALSRPVDAFSEEYRLLHADGTVTWILSRAFPIRDANGNVYRLAGIAEDITERKVQGDMVARLGRILDRSSNEIYIIDGAEARILQANHGAQRNLSYSMEELATKSVFDLMPMMTHDELDAVIAPLRDGTEDLVRFETEMQRSDGSRYPAEVRVHFAPEESPPVYVAILQDISERKEIETRLNYMAYYDALTGLPNRRQLHARVREIIIEANRHGRLAAMVFIDLDRFKVINDSLGHIVGDALLKVVAQRLQDNVRTGDMVARVSGDEFIVLLANIAQVDDVTRIAGKLLTAMAEPVLLPGRRLFVTASLGIALYPRDSGDFEGLFKHADTAMYHAKQLGRNNFQFFTEAMNRRAKRQLALETELQGALARGEFVLHYQPLVNLATGRLVAIEALLRWRHPTLGLVPPVEFIPLAEEIGVIVTIGEWVLEQGCRDALRWHEAGFTDVPLGVNVSSRQFQQGKLYELVSRTLARTGLPPRLLDLELTESLLMQDPDGAVEIMGAISSLGTTFSIDDFGIGYSSLAYLRRFPVQTLKIDRSFVAEIVDNPDDAAITSTIIAMAHNLNMLVIAEGVEDDAQLEALRRLGCDAIQGFHICMPMPLPALLDFLRERERARGEPVSAP
jgi:diguanylate cyclase (GGDEF)-like protein/PAS domain S-box-containing protein